MELRVYAVELWVLAVELKAFKPGRIAPANLEPPDIVRSAYLDLVVTDLDRARDALRGHVKQSARDASPFGREQPEARDPDDEKHGAAGEETQKDPDDRRTRRHRPISPVDETRSSEGKGY